MSWASHNPELWDKVCNQGITTKLLSTSPYKGKDYTEIYGYVEGLQGLENPAGKVIYQVLIDWAWNEINEAHADYVSHLIDSTRVD